MFKKKEPDVYDKTQESAIVDKRIVSITQFKRDNGTWQFHISQACYDRNGNLLPPLLPHEMVGILEYVKAMMLSELSASASSAKQSWDHLSRSPRRTSIEEEYY